MAMWMGFAYIAAAVLFILALRGLSNPEMARQGNRFGMAGMVIAVATTLFAVQASSLVLIIPGVVIGGAIGATIARRIQMTALPQLVAAFHSLVGMAAVFVATAALYNPEAYGIGVRGDIHAGSLIEMALGTAIGAITFSGSVIAFLKLQGLMSGNPITFPMQHPLNLLIGILIVVLIISFCLT
jgi:H+-translocating NAD(P) transhydrogenase subunit beta